jgi:hypothetical protein
MFTTNGNGTYTVRLFKPDGTADYVTVNSELPSGGTIFDRINHWVPNPSSGITPFENLTSPITNVATTTELWVALFEKAYAQENTEGWLPSNDPGSNSFQAMNEITKSYYGTDMVLSAITGLSASGTSPINGTAMASAWQNGKLIVLGTSSPFYPINGAQIVPGHVYAVVGYNTVSKVFTVFNPWGLNGGDSFANDYYSGLVTATATQMAAPGTYPDFSFSTVTGSAAETSANLVDGGTAAPARSALAKKPQSIGIGFRWTRVMTDRGHVLESRGGFP